MLRIQISQEFNPDECVYINPFYISSVETVKGYTKLGPTKITMSNSSEFRCWDPVEVLVSNMIKALA